jgi:hypothetical protein
MTRRPAMVRTRKVKKTARVGKGIKLASTGNPLVKDFNPKDVDVLRYGPEPSFYDKQPTDENRLSELTAAYNWYSRFCTHKDAKQFLINYLEENKVDNSIIRLVRKAPDNRMVTTAGWAARCAVRGLILTDKQKTFIQNCVDTMVSLAKAGVKDDNAVEETEPLKRKVNIQEVMRERADEALSEIEALFDEFIDRGCPKNFDLNKRVIGALTERNVLPQHIAPAIKRWEALLAEYREAALGKCPQLNESYQNYGKMQMRYTIQFIESIIAELNGYCNLKQAIKKVRAKKPIPVEKVVSKLKYKKKDEALGLTSLPPTKVHQAIEVFLYDTKKRKIIWLVADEYSKCLTVKGNKVLGFDQKKSMTKTVRKPEEFVKAFMVASRPNTRKMVTDIKAVTAVPNGRFNENIIILKAW